MTKPYPARAAFIFDVPEPKGIAGKFIYRYFLKDEKASTDAKGSQASFERHGGRYAREIFLEFEPCKSSIGIGTGESSLAFTDAEKAKIFTENVDLITSELEVGSRAFTTMIVQDNYANSALQYAVENSLTVRKVKAKGLSPIQKILKYGSLSQETDAQSIIDYTDVDSTNEFKTFDPKTGETISKVGEGDVGRISFALSINNKFINDIAIKSKNSSLSPIFDAMDPVLSSTSTISKTSSLSDSSKYIEIDDYEPSTTPVSSTIVDVDTSNVYGNVLLGYLITKYEIEPNGQTTFIGRILVTNPKQSSTSDYEVVYGKRYKYTIRSVYLVRILTYDGENFVSSDYLMSSRESPSVEVLCEETQPPPFPIDLKFWLSQERKLCIEWQHPFNKQEDIKRYQVFRRRSIKEPFQLIAELDFDDSVIKTPKGEKILKQSVRKFDYPVSSYSDPSFTLESDYIYAVCSVDARDLSSNFSEQFRVRFQKVHGRLRIDRIATSGAPKPYPNFTLDRALTVDSIKTSGYKVCKLYFDPDYLKVYDLKENDLGQLSTSKDLPSYSIQFINVDLQQDAKVSIYVIDNT